MIFEEPLIFDTITLVLKFPSINFGEDTHKPQCAIEYRAMKILWVHRVSLSKTANMEEVSSLPTQKLIFYNTIFNNL